MRKGTGSVPFFFVRSRYINYRKNNVEGMEQPTSWVLPGSDQVGTIESVKVSELGHVQVKFRIKGEEGCDTFINYTVAKIDELLADRQIYKANLVLEDANQ